MNNDGSILHHDLWIFVHQLGKKKSSESKTWRIFFFFSSQQIERIKMFHGHLAESVPSLALPSIHLTWKSRHNFCERIYRCVYLLFGWVCFLATIRNTEENWGSARRRFQNEWWIVQFVHDPFQWKLVIILIYYICVRCAVHKNLVSHTLSILALNGAVVVLFHRWAHSSCNVSFSFRLRECVFVVIVIVVVVCCHIIIIFFFRVFVKLFRFLFRHGFVITCFGFRCENAHKIFFFFLWFSIKFPLCLFELHSSSHSQLLLSFFFFAMHFFALLLCIVSLFTNPKLMHEKYTDLYIVLL